MSFLLRTTPSALRHSTLKAAALTSIRLQSSTAPSSHLARISEAVKHDHRELEQARDRILAASSHDEKTRWQNQFAWELARHSIGEELVVYPALEKHLADGKGKQLANKDRQEHQSVKEKLYKFQGLDADDAEFEPTFTSLWDDLSAHIRDEEERDLVELEKALDEHGSTAMATSFDRTKMFVPSRSHPSAPDKPPFETVAGLMAAPMDKIGDLFRKFPQKNA